mmetsp:Transcript_8996/g.23573  ORF Transcript_8996/g.23573 Transcript_8996/m.23573 type:complete len:1237 (-) Transcript_8996:2932-6642(-)
MHALLLRLDVLEVRDPSVGLHVGRVGVRLVLVTKEEEGVLGHTATRVNDLVQVEGQDEEDGPLDRKGRQHRAEAVAGVVRHVTPGHARDAKASGDAGVLAVLIPAAVKVPDGEEGDEVLEVVADVERIEEVATVPSEVGNEAHDDDKEGCRDGRRAGEADERREQESKSDCVVDKEQKEDDVHRRVRAGEDADRVPRGERRHRPDEHEKEGKNHVDDHPKEIIDEPVGRRAEAHHAHHDAKLHLLLVNHGRHNGWEEQEHGNGEEKGPKRPADVERELVSNLGHLLETEHRARVLLGVAPHAVADVSIHDRRDGALHAQHGGWGAVGADARGKHRRVVVPNCKVDLGSGGVTKVEGQHELLHVCITGGAKLVVVPVVGLFVDVRERGLLLGLGIDAGDLEVGQVAEALHPAPRGPHGRAVVRKVVDRAPPPGRLLPAVFLGVAVLIILHVLFLFLSVLLGVKDVVLGPPKTLPRLVDRSLLVIEARAAGVLRGGPDHVGDGEGVHDVREALRHAIVDSVLASRGAGGEGAVVHRGEAHGEGGEGAGGHCEGLDDLDGSDLEAAEAGDLVNVGFDVCEEAASLCDDADVLEEALGVIVAALRPAPAPVGVGCPRGILPNWTVFGLREVAVSCCGALGDILVGLGVGVHCLGHASVLGDNVHPLLEVVALLVVCVIHLGLDVGVVAGADASERLHVVPSDLRVEEAVEQVGEDLWLPERGHDALDRRLAEAVCDLAAAADHGHVPLLVALALLAGVLEVYCVVALLHRSVLARSHKGVVLGVCVVKRVVAPDIEPLPEGAEEGARRGEEDVGRPRGVGVGHVHAAEVRRVHPVLHQPAHALLLLLGHERGKRQRRAPEKGDAAQEGPHVREHGVGHALHLGVHLGVGGCKHLGRDPVRIGVAGGVEHGRVRHPAPLLLVHGRGPKDGQNRPDGEGAEGGAGGEAGLVARRVAVANACRLGLLALSAHVHAEPLVQLGRVFLGEKVVCAVLPVAVGKAEVVLGPAVGAAHTRLREEEELDEELDEEDDDEEEDGEEDQAAIGADALRLKRHVLAEERIGLASEGRLEVGDAPVNLLRGELDPLLLGRDGDIGRRAAPLLNLDRHIELLAPLHVLGNGDLEVFALDLNGDNLTGGGVRGGGDEDVDVLHLHLLGVQGDEAAILVSAPLDRESDALGGGQGLLGAEEDRHLLPIVQRDVCKLVVGPRFLDLTVLRDAEEHVLEGRHLELHILDAELPPPGV